MIRYLCVFILALTLTACDGGYWVGDYGHTDGAYRITHVNVIGADDSHTTIEELNTLKKRMPQQVATRFYEFGKGEAPALLYIKIRGTNFDPYNVYVPVKAGNPYISADVYVLDMRTREELGYAEIRTESTVESGMVIGGINNFEALKDEPDIIDAFAKDILQTFYPEGY